MGDRDSRPALDHHNIMLDAIGAEKDLILLSELTWLPLLLVRLVLQPHDHPLHIHYIIWIRIYYHRLSMLDHHTFIGPYLSRRSVCAGYDCHYNHFHDCFQVFSVGIPERRHQIVTLSP